MDWVQRKTCISYKRRKSTRTTKWNYWKLFKFSIDGITSFSKTPLEIWSYAGVFIAFLSFIYGAITILKTLIFGIQVDGYPSLITFILFFSGLQMIGIGMLGSYIGRIFIETKNRPLYIVRKVHEIKNN